MHYKLGTKHIVKLLDFFPILYSNVRYYCSIVKSEICIVVEEDVSTFSSIAWIIQLERKKNF